MATSGSRPSSASPMGQLGVNRAAAPQQGKKLVIKPLREAPKLPDNFGAVTWLKLQAAVNAVHEERAVSNSLEELYRAVEDLCLHKMAGDLYNRLQKECAAHISRQLGSLVGQTSDLLVFLRQVESCWRNHCQQMHFIRSIFLVLDRVYVMQTTGVLSIWDMGLTLFREHLQHCLDVESKTVAGLLMLIERERLGESIDRSLLSTLLKMFVALGLYTESFERRFIEETSSFYKAEGERLLMQSDVPDYLRHVEGRLSEENDRCLNCLDASTRKVLVTAAERQLLQRHVAMILDKGFDMLMEANRREDLRRMYQLLARVQALDAMKVAFGAYVKKTGHLIVAVNDEEKEKEMVSNLLAFKARLDNVLDVSFCKNESYVNTMKESFEHFINARQNRPAELIAKFIDALLKAGNKGGSEEELEATLDAVLVLFRFIQGKDVFEAFYKKDLAKRLLLGKSASIDAEKSMISKLKTECGSQFTNKLEGMFKDIDLSRDIMSSFRQSAISRLKLPPGIEMNVHVLTTGHWPTYTPMEVNLPPELNAYQQIFKEFYLSKHSGRRLMWQNSLGHCMLKVAFPKGKKEVSVSLFQTAVLLLFDDVDKLGYKEIKDATAIEEKELKRTLQSLACAKVRILNKIPRGRDVDETDTFEFNADFSDKHFRIKVNAIQLKETAEENKSTTERVFQDRQYQIDAAIVRIMKMRKSLAHNLLISELFQQLKFPIKPPDLKKRIESLIDREYLERDKKNSNMYNYLA
eukprot:jgi/Mesvir1/3738/Mv15014-RA.1